MQHEYDSDLKILYGGLSVINCLALAPGRTFTTSNGGAESLFVSDISLSGHLSPLLLGLMNYFEKHLPNVGYFQPISGKVATDSQIKEDANLAL